MKSTRGFMLTRRQFAAAAAFTIVPRHVLGGPGYIPPSDKITLATVGMGRQGMFVTMDLLQYPEIQVVAVCDVNRESKDYAEYDSNSTQKAARHLLGAGYEQWGEDWRTPGMAQLTKSFSTSLGIGGRDPAKRLVEAYYAAKAPSGSYKGCNAYGDHRDLFAKEQDLNAVYVATPDHWHASISIAAMKKGKHVLCQKPMAHNVGEARRMSGVARETKVATSLPVNNPSSPSTRLISDWIADGAIGRVREVHNWTSRPYWPQGVDRPKDEQPVPTDLDWNQWLGPAPMRPYNKAYLPFVWRGWYDFGCGSFGDMGCYSFAGIFKILKLTPPTLVEACSGESYEETFPQASIVHMDFPAIDDRPEVHLAWYDGGLHPQRPTGISEQDERLFRHRAEGVMYVGEKGILLAGFNGDNPRVYPPSSKYVAPPRQNNRGGAQSGPPRDGAIEQWISACKGGPAALTNFEIQAPVTESFLLGCLAQRLPGEKFNWDTVNMKITNNDKAGKYLDPPYRDGFEL